MLIFFPTGTDAPIYHWPFATGGLILLNIAVLVLQFMFPAQADWFILQFGTINPIQWFSAMCMHIGISHLIGNIIGLALFGWIIEGKVGWWRFLLICFGIGVSANAFTQLIMIFGNGGALGASGVVFGLIAMAMVWAPENEIRITSAGVFFFRPFAFSFNVTISTLGFFMIGMEWITAGISGFSMSTEVLHLIGAVPGFVIAYLMIRWRRVDCDGYDLISTMKGTRGKRVLTIADEKAQQKQAEESKQEAIQLEKSGLEMVEKYIDSGHYDLAINRFKMLKKNNHSLVMAEHQFVKLIKEFEKDESTKHKSVPLLIDYLKNYERYKAPFTLMLARTYVLKQGRPRQGMRVLKSLEWDELSAKQKKFVRKLIERAKQMIAGGVLEVD